MSFINIELPVCIAMGAVSAPEWRTNVAENQGGWTQANQVWAQCKHTFDISTAVRQLSDYQDVITHFNEVRGRAHTFPFKDPMDHEVVASRGMVSYVSPGVYQLGLRYGLQNPFYRKITRPVNASLFRSGTPMTAGAGLGQYSLDTTTGLLTVNFLAQQGITANTPGATHIFTLGAMPTPAITVGQIVFASGITGTAGAVLNGRPLTVTAVSTSPSVTIAVDVDTTGLVANAGVLQIRDNPSVISWAGEFRVPVRYGSDSLPAQAINSDGQNLYVQATSIALHEVRE